MKLKAPASNIKIPGGGPNADPGGGDTDLGDPVFVGAEVAHVGPAQQVPGMD